MRDDLCHEELCMRTYVDLHFRFQILDLNIINKMYIEELKKKIKMEIRSLKARKAMGTRTKILSK